VVHIGLDAPVRALVALLREHDLGAVVVSADGRTIAGIAPSATSSAGRPTGSTSSTSPSPP